MLITTLLFTTRLELDPGFFTFLLKLALLFGLLYAMHTSSLEAKYWDNDFVDEEDKACPSLGVLIIVHGTSLELSNYI